ncbi:MAG: ImmA/IrrE family metallo-endopeptidase [bacterium]
MSLTAETTISFIEDLAAQYGVKVVYEIIPDGREAYTTRDTIVLNPEVYPPRLNYAFCHELAHWILNHPFEPFLRKDIEQEAEVLAIELMLPREEFLRAMRSCDLAGLKERFPYASWEVLARRLGEFQPAVVSIFDDGLLTRRIAPPNQTCPRHPTSAEMQVVVQAFNTRSHQKTSINGLRLNAYYLDEGTGVSRVILLTEVLIDG